MIDPSSFLEIYSWLEDSRELLARILIHSFLGHWQNWSELKEDCLRFCAREERQASVKKKEREITKLFTSSIPTLKPP